MTQYGAGRIFAVVLTAGAGSRLGGLCKGLLRVQGKTLLARQVAALAQVPVQGCVAVLGHQAQSVRDEITQIRLADLGGFGLEEFRLESTEVQTPGIGRSGREDIQISVRQGLLAVSGMLSESDLGILVTLVDCPLINSDSIRHLLETAVRDCADIVIPERDGTDDACKQPVTGHPIFLSRRVVLGFDLADPKFSLRSFLQTCDVADRSAAPEFRVIRMRTQDPAFFKDIDTPQDILSLHREHGLLVEIP